MKVWLSSGPQSLATIATMLVSSPSGLSMEICISSWSFVPLFIVTRRKVQLIFEQRHVFGKSKIAAGKNERTAISTSRPISDSL